MKVLVLSDSHGCKNNMFRAIEQHPDCKTVFFLGDGLADAEKAMEQYPDRKFICVKGNNDYHYNYDETAYKHIDGNTVVACHGHRFFVRQNLTDLFLHAQSVLANTVFYGHTHRADFHFDPYYKMYALNPGALCEGKYAVADLSKSGVEASLLTL